MNFEEWLDDVDKELLQICGLTHMDLGDFPSRDMFDEGVEPREAAEICLLNWNDFPEDLLTY